LHFFLNPVSLREVSDILSQIGHEEKNMKEGINPKQKDFTLTNDFAPIILVEDSAPSFICPLPRGYKIGLGNLLSKKEVVLGVEISMFERGCRKIEDRVNRKMRTFEGPFQNTFFLGYEERSETELDKLHKSFRIERISVDQRGVFGVWAGPDHSSGDIYLATSETQGILDYYYFPTADAFCEYFEKGTSFQCHNVDYYWQALLLREFCVEYFNLLNEWIFGDQKELYIEP